MIWHRSCALLLVSVLLVEVAWSNPARRSPDVEARRRSAVDRNMIRFGRSPPEMTAADIREAIQRSTRRTNNFLRFGRSQPMTLTADDLISLLQSYNEDPNNFVKRGANFVRLGRDPKFIRFGRSLDDEKQVGYLERQSEDGSEYQQRKGRARDHFVRLGRDNEELNEGNDFDEVNETRKKRSTDSLEM